MLTWLSEYSRLFQPLNLFRYITFRTGGATATALFFVFFFGPGIIAALRLKQGKGQPIRDDGPQSHILLKDGNPDDGRPDDLVRPHRLDLALGKSAQSFRLDRAFRHDGLRR